MLKDFLPGIKQLYSDYSGKYSAPGAPKFVSLEEFIMMITNSGVVSETFGAREIGIYFNSAMMTQVNEVDNNRHM